MSPPTFHQKAIDRQARRCTELQRRGGAEMQDQTSFGAGSDDILEKERCRSFQVSAAAVGFCKCVALDLLDRADLFCGAGRTGLQRR